MQHTDVPLEPRQDAIDQDLVVHVIEKVTWYNFLSHFAWEPHNEFQY